MRMVDKVVTLKQARREAGGRSGMSTQEGEVLTLEELAKYLKISRSTLYKLVRSRRIPGRKIGRSWRFHKSTIDRWLKVKSAQTS